MRTLKFIVEKQIIRKDPSCDFEGLIPGTEGYLMAEFSFSQEWDGCVKIATFWSSLGKEFTPQILKDGKTCLIPSKALVNRNFGVQVIGKKGDFKIVTNKEYVCQKGG